VRFAFHTRDNTAPGSGDWGDVPGGGIETEPADRAEAGSFGQASLCALEHNASLG